MARCNKMDRAGLQFLRETFMNNPNIPFTQLLALYNMKAVDRGWRCLKSSGTLSYHLNAMGLYKYNTRHIVPHKKKGVDLSRQTLHNKKLSPNSFLLLHVLYVRH